MKLYDERFTVKHALFGLVMGLAGFSTALAGAIEGVWGGYSRNQNASKFEFTGPEARVFAALFLVFFLGITLVSGFRIWEHLKKQ